MRRALLGVFAVALSILPSALPATADAAADVQTVPGSIAAPTRFTDVNGGFPGLGRRLWLVAPQSNGLVSYTFNVDKATWGGAFELRDVKDATGAGDLDIYFYADFGNLPLSNTGGVACSTAEYAAGGPGEKGFIPPGSTRAIVFTPDAVNATFTYAATEMPKINLAGGSLDLTVPVGAFVGWHNNTGDYSYVRHIVPSGNEPMFDSSPGPASGLRNGEVFSHQFAEAGQYRYQTSTGIGTITVLDQGPGPGTPAAACTM